MREAGHVSRLDVLRTKLRVCPKNDSPEGAHRTADEALLEYIDDDEVTYLFTSMEKWYA